MRTRVILASIIALAWALSAGCAMTGVPAAPAVVPQAKASSEVPSKAIATMQLYLAILGYNPGPINGMVTDRTGAALNAYAQGAGIVLNDATLDFVLDLLEVEAAEQRRKSNATERQRPAGTVQNMPFKAW